MFTNVLMIAIAAIVGLIIIQYIREENITTATKRFTIVLGFFTFLWVLGYAFFGISSRFSRAEIYRVIGIIGIDGFLTAELFFVLFQARVNKNLQICLYFIYTVLAVLDVIIFGNSDVNRLVRVGQRVSYFANKVWQRDFHNIYIVIITFGLAAAWLFWRKKSTSKREKHFQNLIFIANSFVLLGCIPDTILPIYGFRSWPSSSVGGALAFLCIYFIDKKYSVFEISQNDLKNFIYKYAGMGIAAFDLERNLLVVNEYAKQILGIDKIENNMKLSDIFEISVSDERALFNDVLNGHAEVIRLVVRNNKVPTSVVLHVDYDESGYPYGVYGTIIDKRNEEKMIEQLSELNEAKSTFLTNMSHEIRTPVNTLMGMDEMILRQTKEPRIANYAANIKSSCNLLISIINDILDFSKIESGELALNEVEYSLAHTVRDLVNLVEERTHKKGLSMYVDVDQNLPDRLFGDEVRVRQIATNLLTNAIKYTDYGTITLKVSDAGREDGKIKLSIDVIDTGKGIKKEDQKRLFEAFSRLDEKRNRHIEGTGLGLSITSHFVSLMNGSLCVESEYGKGSDFNVIIPQVIADDSLIGDYRKDRESFDELKDNEKIIAPGAKVLLVDDNEMNLKVAALLLEETKMEVETALSGEIALELMRHNSYDLILLDHMMPGMDGVEVLNHMKDENLKKDIPVVVLTANAIAGAREMYISIGFDDYLSKPIICQELNRVLINFLPKSVVKIEEVKR